MHSDTTKTWLQVASAVVIGFGFIIALSAHPALSGITRFMVDLAFWPLDGTQTINSPEMRLILAVSGGMMMGWGALLWLVATRLYPRDPALARTMILWSIGIWFIVDNIGSVAAGAPLNVLFNVPFLLVFVLPLMRSARHAEA